MKTTKMQKLLASNELPVIGFTLVLSLVIGLVNPAFFSSSTVVILLRAMLVTVVFSLAEMLVIISGGIDMSFPAIACFSLYATVNIMLKYGINSVLFAFVCSGVIGMALGSFNALLIGVFNMPPLIATLGTSSLISGATLAFIGANEIIDLPTTLNEFSKKFIITVTSSSGIESSLTVMIFIPIVLAILVHLLLKYTIIGRGIYATGGDKSAARIAGFNILKIQFIVYMLSGLFTGIAGMIQTILLRDAHPSSLIGGEMMVIAAVVIGGTRITGGHGKVIGTILGVLLVTIVSNNLILLGIPNYWQTFAVGLIIVIGTALTSIKAKNSAHSPKV